MAIARVAPVSRVERGGGGRDENGMAAMETGERVTMAACHVPGLRWGVSCGRAVCDMGKGSVLGG